jgi:hypothetical protein
MLDMTMEKYAKTILRFHKLGFDREDSNLECFNDSRNCMNMTWLSYNTRDFCDLRKCQKHIYYPFNCIHIFMDITVDVFLTVTFIELHKFYTLFIKVGTTNNNENII